MSQLTYRSIHPIGDSDPRAMPVADAAVAARDYEARFGFHVMERQEGPPRSVTVARDAVEIVLVENGEDPEQASCYIEVSDVDLARQELAAQGLDLSGIRTDQHGGATYRVFFAKDNDGLCYCIGRKQDA
jgi:hypothetical protein